jgi:DNA-binding IclR family transcriptional regulator
MVQVIIKAFDILELIAKSNGQAISLTEIAKGLDMSQPTAANIINTMVSRGYIDHIGKKKGYKLGPSAFKLTNQVPYEKELLDNAKAIMENLTSQINETCLLGVLRNYKRFIIHVVNSNHDIQVQVRSERNVYETASGRILLAYLSNYDRENFIKQHGLPDQSIWPEACTENDLKNTLDIIKNEGLVTTYSAAKDIKGFAVPILIKEKAIAALSIFAPEYRCTPTKQKMIIEALMRASLEIGNNLN